MKILLVYNPAAGHGKAGKILPQVQEAFQKKSLQLELFLTEKPRHAISYLEKADLSNYDGVVAAGGDGTLFEVVNGLYRNPDGRSVVLGALPVGTGNAFVRDMVEDPFDWRAIVDIIARGQTKKVDVGRFETNGKTYYYLNILGLGFVADVTGTAHKLKIFGNISYTLGVFYQTLLLNTNRLTIQVDGKTLEQENVFVEISNTRYTSNFLMAPNARIDDGLLDVTVVRKLSRRRLLQCFPKIFSGEHIFLPEVDHFPAKEIRIDTEPEKILTPDGELFGKTPISVTCLQEDISMFWPK